MPQITTKIAGGFIMNEVTDIVGEVKELVRRAANALAEFGSHEESDVEDGIAVTRASRLLKAYVTGHEVAAKSPHYEAWVKATRGTGFFHGCLNRAYQQTAEFRDQI